MTAHVSNDEIYGLGEDRPPRAWTWVVGSVAAFVAVALLWASIATVEELSRAEGRVIPTSRAQIVQSAEGGVVTDILVRPGEQVTAGQQLILIDDTPTASSAGEVQARVHALEAQIARLQAEYSATTAASYICPESVAAISPDICANEVQLMQVREQSLLQGTQVLMERAEQRERELAEAQANLNRIDQNLGLAQEEIDLMSPLATRGLVAQTTFIAAQRDLAELTGQKAATEELIGRLQSGVEEAALQVQQADTQFRQDALAEMTVKLAELASARQQLLGASDRVARTDIRSPVDGVVNSLEITTIGAVVQPGERLLDIVPVSDTLLVEARLNPADVAFILPGQPANVKLTAYDFAVFGGLEGVVENVSADSIVDPQTQETYYTVLISADATTIEHNGDLLPIIPGMVSTVEIITGEKTILQYLITPITKAGQEALRER